MPVKIENLTNRPVLLTLASGQTLRLSPGEISAKLGEVEVKNNPKIQKLQERRVIGLHEVTKRGAPARAEVEEREDTPARSKKKKAESTEADNDNATLEGAQ